MGRNGEEGEGAGRENWGKSGRRRRRNEEEVRRCGIEERSVGGGATGAGPGRGVILWRHRPQKIELAHQYTTSPDELHTHLSNTAFISFVRHLWQVNSQDSQIQNKDSSPTPPDIRASLSDQVSTNAREV